MIKAAIEKILELHRPPSFQINGRNYFSNQEPVHEPKPATIELSTLSGLVDFVKELEEYFIHVQNETQVCVRGPVFGPFQQRTIHAISRFTQDQSSIFHFGRWYQPEEFIIALQSQFVESNHLSTILSVVGNIKDENVKTTAGDGNTQTVTARGGIALVKEVLVPNPVTLYPYRTFLEIEQPPLLCVLRLKSGVRDSGTPGCALFEADGGLWKLTAINRIKEWLLDNLPDVMVIA
jgi:hypothetical protein